MRTETFLCQSVPRHNERLKWRRPFEQPPAVTVKGLAGLRAEVDGVTEHGCRVRLFDAKGEPVSGHFRLTAEGE